MFASFVSDSHRFHCLRTLMTSEFQMQTVKGGNGGRLSLSLSVTQSRRDGAYVRYRAAKVASITASSHSVMRLCPEHPQQNRHYQQL